MARSARVRRVFLLGLASSLAACGEPSPSIQFSRVALSGLPAAGKTSGVVVDDLDGDGRPDLLLGRHSGVPRALLQTSDLHFVANETWGAGLEARDHHATLLHDFDGDGQGDLYLVVGAGRGAGIGANTLALGHEHGFRDVAESLGVEDRFGRGRGAFALDLDADGSEELFVANFKTPARVFAPAATSPWTDRAADLFGWPPMDEARAAARVEDVGARRSSTYAHELLPLDVGGDGRVDLVAFGGPPLQLLRNTEAGMRADLPAMPPEAYLPAPVRGCVADFDGDGNVDIYLVYGDDDAESEFDRRRENRLLMGDGERFRTNPSPALELGGKGVDAAAGDLDGDGDVDLVVAQCDRGRSRTRLLAFRNDGSAHFTPWDLGESWAQERTGISDGLLLADMDLDGDLDLIPLLGGGGEGELAGGGAILLRNDASSASFLRVRLVDARGGPGYGARVELHAGDRVQYRSMLPSTVRGSAFPLPLHFGVGKANRGLRLVVRWPDGTPTERRDLRSGSEVVVREGSRTRP